MLRRNSGDLRGATAPLHKTNKEVVSEVRKDAGKVEEETRAREDVGSDRNSRSSPAAMAAPVR